MKIRDLMLQLLDFNLDAEIVSNLDFGWSATDNADKDLSKMQTNKVCIYSDDNLPDVEVE